MAKGSEDWNVFVDIKAQTLLPVVIRPVYGTASSAASAFTLNNDDELAIITIAGVGVTYAGYLNITSADVLTDLSVRIIFDNLTSFIFTVGQLASFLIVNQYRFPFFIHSYPVDLKSVFISITPGLTFDSSFQLLLTRDPGKIASGYALITHALV